MLATLLSTAYYIIKTNARQTLFGFLIALLKKIIDTQSYASISLTYFWGLSPYLRKTSIFVRVASKGVTEI